MRELPSGTVTFLFTDIEGSTGLLDELGPEEYAEELAEHRRVLRAAFEEHGGVEVDTQGDAFFVAFGRARDALDAAVDVQRALANGPVRVRIGLHTGEPLLTAEGYAGMDVHRGARIAAAGHGGQVLVSDATCAVVRHDLSTGLSLEDLGEHRLKDLTQPTRLFQLGGEGLEHDFAPLRTLDLRRTNLPSQPTPLIGRERELAQVAELLERPEVALATITGPGGAGKTRLALQVAADLVEDFDDGVYFVSLGSVAEPSLVLPAIGSALSVRMDGAVDPAAALAEHLREREVLLLLDNFEHLVDAGPAVVELARHAPRAKLLLTSRASLRLSGEHEFPIPELDEPDAVALFAERAQAVRPDFRLNGDRSVVAEICRRVDSLPLAIELAAARVKILSPQALLARLDERLAVLTTGARDVPERLRTLRDAIAWSHDLLGVEEQETFAALAVFAGSFTLEAAEEVCGAELDAVASLVENSLLRQAADRLRMLQTIREYALEQLQASARREDLLRRHAEFFLAFAEHGDRGDPKEIVPLIDRLDAEQANLRAALQGARELGDGVLELRLVVAISPLWGVRSMSEGLEHMRRALKQGADAPLALRLNGLRQAVMWADKQGKAELARALSDELLVLCGDDEVELARAFNTLGVLALTERRFDEARQYLEQALAKAPTVVTKLAATHNLGCVALNEGDFERALTDLERSLELAKEANDEFQIDNARGDIGFALLGLGRHAEARDPLLLALREAIRLHWYEHVAYCLVGVAALAALDGAAERAARLLGRGCALIDELQLVFEDYAVAVRTQVERDLTEALGADAYAAAFSSGGDLTFEQVQEEALG